MPLFPARTTIVWPATIVARIAAMVSLSINWPGDAKPGASASPTPIIAIVANNSGTPGCRTNCTIPARQFSLMTLELIVCGIRIRPLPVRLGEIFNGRSLRQRLEDCDQNLIRSFTVKRCKLLVELVGRFSAYQSCVIVKIMLWDRRN
jgi:hypothetical protein